MKVKYRHTGFIPPAHLNCELKLVASFKSRLKETSFSEKSYLEPWFWKEERRGEGDIKKVETKGGAGGAEEKREGSRGKPEMT